MREPFLSYKASSKKVLKVVRRRRTPFGQKDVVCVDTVIFQRWVEIFILNGWSALEEKKWIVLYYDGLRAQMYSAVIEDLLKHKSFAIVLPDHTSNRLQPLEVSLFGPLKHHVTARVKDCFAKACAMGYNKKVGGLDLWKSIVHAFGDAFTLDNASSGFTNSRRWFIDVTKSM